MREVELTSPQPGRAAPGGPLSHTRKRAAQGAQTPLPTAAPGGCCCGFYSLSPHHSFLLYIWKGND